MSGTRSDVRSDVRADARADEGVGGILYGMWWDEGKPGNYVSLPIDGESGMIFETTMQNTASKVIGGLSDVAGGAYFGYFLDGGTGNTQATAGTPAYYVDGVLVANDQDDLHDALSDGLPHAFRVTGLNLSSAVWTQLIIGGYNANFIPEGTYRDVVLRQSDETIVGSWNGYGNTNADWEDQVGSNDGTVAGSPSRAVSTDGGVTWAMETASDADAAAYITRLRNAGASITPTQVSALDTFFLTGKSEGWYSELKRMYLPIWAAAGPNAICMVSGSSGTFSGTVTHASGYVQGNGSTGAFDSVTDMVTLGLTTSSASLFYGAYSVTSTTNSDFYGGAYKTSPTSYVGAFRFDSTGGDRYIGFINNASGAGTINSSLGPLGVNVITRTETGSYGVYKNGDVTVGVTSFAAAVPPLSAMFMARSYNGSSNSHADGKMYCFGVGLGLSATEAKSLANATQTLWETTTGLSL